MKSIFVLIIGITLMACDAQSQSTDLKTTKDTSSYALGVNIGKSLSQQGLDIDADILMAGLKDAIAGSAKLNDDQVRASLTALQETMMKKEQEKAAATGAANLKKGEEFLAKNKKAPGVITTASGLQYQVVTEGKGAKPTKESTVRVHYRGTTIDGKQFDASYDRGEPAEFPLNGVIAGWTEGLQLMTVGSKYKFFIPANLAYGERGAGGAIGPNETLIFDVELLEIKK